MNKAHKATYIADMNAIFAKHQAGILVDFKGMTVEEIGTLRNTLREQDSKMKVLKNRIASLAIDNTPFAGLKDNLVENRAFIYSQDLLNASKAVIEYADKNKKLKVVGAVLVRNEEGSVFNAEQLDQFSKLPSYEVLLAQLLGLMTAPASRFVRTLNEVPASFVRVLSAVSGKKAE